MSGLDGVINRLREALDLCERIEMLGSAPPVGLDLEVKEHELRRRALLAQLGVKLALVSIDVIGKAITT